MRNYKIFNSTLQIFKKVQKFLSLMQTFKKTIDPLQVTKSMLDTVKTYNSRLTQLIVGGGAKITGQLKIISAKHLSTAATSLTFMLDQNVFIQDQIQQVIKEFQSVNNDMKEHRNLIYQKLSSLIIVRISKFCDIGANEIQWTQEPNIKEVENKNYYLNKIISDVQDMYNILKQYFEKYELSEVFSPTLQHIASSLLELLSNQELNKALAKRQYFIQSQA